MKRALLAILGAILIVVGIGAGGVGGTLAALTGPDAAISGDAGTVNGNKHWPRTKDLRPSNGWAKRRFHPLPWCW